MPDVSAKGPPLNHDTALRHLQSAVGRTMQTVEAEVAGLLNPLQDEGDSRGGTTLAGLFRLLFDRARASRTLVCYGMDWDAEIILRAFYETTAKILRLCVSPEDEKVDLRREYWVDAAETHNRRKKLRASLVERQAEPFDEVATAIFSLLQDDRITPVSPESTKADRKAIEQKWSFGGIVEYLSEQADRKFDLGNAKLLMHSYGMASHFVHSDHNALELMEDRSLRSPEDRRLVEAAHAARILTDQTSLAFLCAAALSLHLNAPFNDKTALASQV
jgi:Family of unknown function (DUF5677)